jgi:hypothetical protein
MQHHAVTETRLPIGYSDHDNSNAKDPTTALQVRNQMSTKPMRLLWIETGTTPRKKVLLLEMNRIIPLEAQEMLRGRIRSARRSCWQRNLRQGEK